MQKKGKSNLRGKKMSRKKIKETKTNKKKIPFFAVPFGFSEGMRMENECAILIIFVCRLSQVRGNEKMGKMGLLLFKSKHKSDEIKYLIKDGQ